MKRTASFILLFLLVGFCYAPQDDTIVYVKEGRTNWKDAFSEPFEIFYMKLYDTRLIGLTTQEENRINITVTFIKEFLKSKGKKISDIAIIVHNHFPSPFFSWDNGIFLKRLKGEGFNGSFGVYHVPTDTIKWAVRDEG